MNRTSRLIAKYIIRTIIPYLAFAWLLLSVILFVQQASRFSDIFFNNNLPSKLIWQLSLALVPNVIAFTCPMAILIGVIIGISKMQGDNELIAIRATGISNLQITIPIVFLGLLLSVFAFSINLKGVPFAAQIVRKVAAQTALYKLESPIEPGVFNTEIQGFTIYVKDGDVENGTWKNIFIYSEDKNTNQVRLITSQNGRIDSKNETSELVLEKATVTTFSISKPYKNLFSEKIENLRFVIQTQRGALIDKLGKTEETPEELGLTELAAYAATKTGKEKIEADILWQRRLVLSITPFLFALLGASLILRFNRGGKGFGIFLALISLIIYYLAALLGEQLARTGVVSVFTASLFPILLTLLAIVWFFLSQRISARNRTSILLKRFKFNRSPKIGRIKTKNTFANLTTGILDFDIVSSLLKYFLLTFGFLTSVYMIFTAFELWKFAGNINNGINLLIKYLVFLIPFIYIQISPSALMIAMLATYVIKSRQNEVVTWTASGQSIYRLLFPCFVLMMVIGLLNWEIQERILPETNQIQDALRTQIRNKGMLSLNAGKYWVANENRIYSFELENTVEPINDQQKVNNLSIYQFADDRLNLQSFIKTDNASWEQGKIRFLSDSEKTVWVNGVPQTEIIPASGSEIAENYNPFKNTLQNPNHLSTSELLERLKTTESQSEWRSFSVALLKKYSTPFLPLIITFFTAPFALSLSRKGKVTTLGYAIGMWLLFMGISSTFEQFGISGYVSPQIAVIGPLIIFSFVGAYLLSKVQT
jgi:lipopolysaccharide export LptBFGC system permease protein LptF